MFRWIAILMLLLAGAPQALAAAASPEEEQALKAASESFRLTYYERAEKDFGGFVQKFPASDHVAEAIFFQAEARLKQTNYSGAISLLTTNLGSAGAWADKYLYSLGQAYVGLKAYDQAADSFGRLARDYPASTNRLEASLQEAVTRARLSAWENVIHLLRDTNGIFQVLARTNLGNNFVFQGYLLLSEAELAQKDYAAAQLALDPFKQTLLQPTNAWLRQHLICRIQVAAGQLSNALQSAESLLVMASNTTLPSLQAESFAFKADLLEKLGRRDEAITAYTNNLVEGIPAARQRQALFKTAELSISQNRIAEGAQTLERFLAQNPKIASGDLAWLSLGELRLRQYYESSGAASKPADAPGTAGDTNILNKAKAAFMAVAANFPQSPLIGKSQLNLGWCYLLEPLPNPVESEKQFYAALDRLPRSADRAMAHFKLADLQFKRGNCAGAVTNYAAVVEEAGTEPGIETNLFELALYQTVRAGLAVTNNPAARNALAKLLAWYPHNYHTEGAVLLTGQAVSRENPAEAGFIFADYLKSEPDGQLRPEIELAIARTYELQQDWTNAFRQYESWLGHYTNHEARPRAEYARAEALSQMGDQTNAFIGFTNFVAHYPTNELTPLAQWRIADYYYFTGAYADAETSYAGIAGNAPKTELAFQARLMAGRAAVGRTSYENASQFYFWPLSTNQACPPEVRNQALFEYANALISQDSTNKTEDYKDAIKAFNLICQSTNTNTLSILAWGQIANCYLQLAQGPGQLTNSIEYFQRIVDEPRADASARSIAKVGLAVVLKKQADEAPPEQQLALRKRALDNYLDVFDRRILRPGETPDAFWTKKAGMEAAQLASTIELWDVTTRILERLLELMPELRPILEKPLLKAQEHTKMVQANK
jgi:TolA-binding protein